MNKTIAEFPELLERCANTNTLDPDKITLGSQKKVFWTCDDGHVFERKVANYVKRTKACPMCSFAPIQSDLLKYWSHNNAVDFNSVSKGSRFEALWICEEGHEFLKEVKKVTGLLEFTCDKCFRENSLEVSYPDLLEFYSEKLNGFPAKSVNVSKAYSIWWSFPCGHHTKRNLKSF